MTVLTWRDVAVPDFRGATDGLETFSKLLNSGLNAARNGITEFDKQKTDDANNQFLAQIAGAQTEDAAKALLANLSSNPNLSRISGETIKTAMSRPGDLLSLADKEGDHNFTTYNRGRVMADNANLDAAKPDALRYIQASLSGDDATAKQVLASSPTLGKLTAAQLIDLADKGQGLTKGNQSILDSRQSYNQSGTRFQNEQTDRQEARLADVAMGVLRESGIGPEDWNHNFGALRDRLVSTYGAETGALIAEKARRLVFNDPTAVISGGSDGGGGAAGGAGGDLTRVMNYVAQGKGISAIPDNVQTLGQWSNWASDLNNKGIKETAGGLFQIVGSTLRQYAPVALGSDWQNKPLTAENQDKIAEKIFDANKGSASALSKQWTSLTPAEAESVRKLPWAQAREIIAKGESGASNVQNLITQGAQDFVAQAGPQYNRSQDNGQAFARGMLDAMNSDADPRSVAQGLTKTVLAGEDIGNVTGLVKRIAQQYHISAAAAGLVVQKSVDQNKNWMQRFGDNAASIIGGGDGLNAHVDWDAVKQYGELAGNRDGLLKQATASHINDAVTQAAGAAAQLDAAARQAAQSRISLAQRNGRSTNVGPLLQSAATAADTHSQARDFSAGITAGGGRPAAPPPKIDQKAVPQNKASQVISAASDPHIGRRFGDLNIYVPEGKFKTQEDLNRYVGQTQDSIRTQFRSGQEMALAADRITKMGGIIGQQQRAAFVAQYKMSPEEGLRKGREIMATAKNRLKSAQ